MEESNAPSSLSGFRRSPTLAATQQGHTLDVFFFLGGFREFGVTNRRTEQDFHSDRIHLRTVSQRGVLHGGGVWG